MIKGFTMNKYLLALITSIGLLHSASAADCVITETHFDPDVNLCCPTLSLDATGWYDPTLDLSSVCKGEMTTGLEHVKFEGLSASLSTESSNIWDKKDLDMMFVAGYRGPDASGTQYGVSALTAQPKLLHPFIKANTSSNAMFVNVGSTQNFPFLTLSINGFEPESEVTMSFDLSSLLDESYFEYLTTEVCVGTKGKKLSDFITDYTYSATTGISTAKALEVSVISSDQSYKVNTGYFNTLDVSGATPTTETVAHGATTTVNHTAKTSKSGSVSFIFFRSADCYKIPLGIDNIKVTGKVKPQIAYSGNPCPKQELRVYTKQMFPEGTTYSWKESVTKQSSDSKVFRFEPQDPDTDYIVSCSVKLPDCDETFESDEFVIHSGKCCENNGHPMAMTNIFFDDFGTFVSDDTYEWTDRAGVIHTENIPAGQIHEAQSVSEHIPYVKAYNIEYSGATLDIPFLGDGLPKDPWDGTGVKTEMYNHGVYLISKRAAYSGGVIKDADGNDNGGMLQFDLQDQIDDGTGNPKRCEECPMDQFFNIDIDNICVGTKITFNADLAAINNIDGGIVLSLEYNEKSLFTDKKLFQKGSTQRDAWQKVNGELEIKPEDVPAGVSKVKIKMKLSHYPYKSDGTLITDDTRDYAVDNILFQVCTPPDVAVDAVLTGGTSLLELCSDETLELKADVSTSTKEYYDDIIYLFQWSKQDPDITPDSLMIWNDLKDESGNQFLSEGSIKIINPANHEAFAHIQTKEDNVYFRVVIGEKDYLTKTDIWKTQSAFNPCRAVSISTIPIKAGLNCAACSHLDFEDKGVTFTADNGKFDAKKKVVELCAGESVKLGIEEAVHGIDKDGDDYNDYEVKWFKEDVSSTALEPKKCKTGEDDVAPSITVSYDDVESAGSTGVKYIISFHDYFDPTKATTPCDMTDTITVIANPKPTEKLENPDPFCEGTLAQEPDKSISGYEISWYEDADTQTGTDEPVIGGLTKDETPKSYYYVLTDTKTGCRGDANEYVVEVNKAEANVVSNAPIDYKKVDAKNGSLKPLDKQKPSSFKDALSVAGHKLMIGLVEGATDQTEPDLSTAKLGTASETFPVPAVKDVNNSDDEYLWYYTYLETEVGGCLSDTILVPVVIKGAPSPTTENAAYCVNSSSVRPMSDYATKSTDGKATDELKFYGTDKTTPMDKDDRPDVTTPGKYTYWASQVGEGGESSKQQIVIEVYGVNDVELSEASHKYCKGADATPLENIATAKASSDKYIQNTGWEFFESNEPTLNEKTAGADTKMSVSTSSAGEFKYYARLKYEVPKSTEVCYGKHVEYTVEIQSVADPIAGTISYTKNEGKNGFKKPTDQDPNAIVGDANCADCSIVWYDKNKNKIDESAATPVYNENLEGNETHTYYVKQVNKLGCESDFQEVTIIVSGYPTPDVSHITVCENSDKLSGTLKATATPSADNAAADFTLYWYESKADGTMDETTECSEIELSPSIQKAADDGSKTKTYTYYVLQRLGTDKNKQSAAVPVRVTVNTNPKLTKLVTDPKCKGEKQKLSEMFDIDIKGCEATYYDANQGSMVTMQSDVVTEAGLYEVKGWYIINEGTANAEKCWSQPEDLTVVFHELDAAIVGSDRTCPGVSVDLDADITVGGGLKASDVRYTWTNDANSKTGSDKAYNTGSDGLEATGDMMKVTLTVESDACKPQPVFHNIKVGDGRLIGYISFSEDKNTTEFPPTAIKAEGTEFESCGGKVAVKLTGIENKGNTMGYELSGTSSEKGTFGSETDGEATLSLGEGKYTLSYINECPTKFEFEIIDYSNKAKSTNGKMVICEKENWFAEITDIQGPKPTIEWQKDGDVIAGETNAKLQLNPAKPEDSGVYTYTLYSAGCRFDGKIALGDALKVKPYAVMNENSYKKTYEVVNGDNQEINIEFKVPADVAEIESDVKWSDVNTGFSQTGTGVDIAPVTTDYNLHVVAENKDYCKAETDIVVLVDARLKMTAELEREEICEGETTKLIVDTTGTGKILHKSDFVFEVTETTKDGSKTIKLTPNRGTGKLEAEVSPVHDATYTVTYTYKVGSQDESKTLGLTVHEKFQVEWADIEPVCEGDVASVVITKVQPSNTELDWSDNPAGELMAGSISGASFAPTYTASGVAPQKKTYKVIAKNGICQDKPFMIPVEVHKPIDGQIKSADKICQFDELKLDASSYQAETYEWKYEEKDSVFVGATASLVPDPDYATFTLGMTRGKCSAEVQKYVEVTSAPSVLQVDSLNIRQVEIEMEVGLGTGAFKYIIDGNEDDPEIMSNIRDGLSYSEHVVKVIDEVGCSTEFRFVVNNPAIEIPIIVSPNEDGVGDKFTVKGLAEGYPEAKVSIFDRWGKKLASYNAGDGTDWDGVYNGMEMPSTDYWYEIQIKEIKKTYTGHFTLIRQ